MICVSVRYHSILRHRAGVEQETVTLPQGTSLLALLVHLVAHQSPGLQELLLTPEGTVTPGLVIFRNGQLVRQDQRDLTMADGDELKLFPMISGGH